MGRAWFRQIIVIMTVQRPQINTGVFIKLLNLDDAYMHQWTGFSAIHVIACSQFATNQLSETILTYCECARKFSEIKNVSQFVHAQMCESLQTLCSNTTNTIHVFACINI